MGRPEQKLTAANRVPLPQSSLFVRVVFCGAYILITIQQFQLKYSQVFLFPIFYILVPLISVTFPLLVSGVYMSMSTHCFIIVLRGIPYGLAVRIPGFHPGGPGSTPGMGIHFLSLQTSEVLFLSFYQALRLKLSLSK